MNSFSSDAQIISIAELNTNNQVKRKTQQNEWKNTQIGIPAVVGRYSFFFHFLATTHTSLQLRNLQKFWTSQKFSSFWRRSRPGSWGGAPSNRKLSCFAIGGHISFQFWNSAVPKRTQIRKNYSALTDSSSMSRDHRIWKRVSFFLSPVVFVPQLFEPWLI